VEPEPRLGRSLAIALKSLQGHLDAGLNDVGSSFPVYLVLRHVAEYPGVSQRALAQRLGIEGPTLTHHLDRLAADGLVERVRNTDDRRVWSTMLTGKGEARLRAAVAVADDIDTQFRSLFSPAELQTFMTCLQRITDTYGRHRP
jgi:MarR family transcriptional regulator for hemolysin